MARRRNLGHQAQAEKRDITLKFADAQQKQENQIKAIRGFIAQGVDAPKDLYLTSVASDQVMEGRVAGDWLVKTVGDKPCKVVELQGTVGSIPAINRKKGFEEAMKDHKNITIARSQTGDCV